MPFFQKRKIDSLDLSVITGGVMRRHGWAPDRAQTAEREYRQFLYLLTRSPFHVVSPWSQDLDLYWHEHILHTSRYAAECKKIFNRFIHHDPTISNNPTKEIAAKRYTAATYYALFGSKAGAGESWLVPTMATLAAVRAMSPTTPTVPRGTAAGGSCGGGDAGDSGGHSGGGHSCGGHSSCGGHGGGGSCGGGSCGGH
jgi:hypothetical protein